MPVTKLPDQITITLTEKEKGDIGGWVNKYESDPSRAVRLVFAATNEQRYYEIARQFGLGNPDVQPPRPPQPPESEGMSLEPVRDWPADNYGSNIFIDAGEMVMYSYRFKVAHPPYVTASPLIRGTATLVGSGCIGGKVSRLAYDLDGWNGVPFSAGGVANADMGWIPELAGETLYFNFAVARGMGSRRLEVLIQHPMPQVA